MHLNFSFSAVQILWTITFAALLVLLVVLLGRDRARRFPWFTAGIVLTALRLLASRMLFGRLAQIPLGVIFITLADLSLILGLLVLVEVARRTFVGLGKRAWLAGSVVLLAVSGGLLALWGPWPAWSAMDHNSLLGALQLMQLTAQKGQLLLDMLTVEVVLLILLLGSRFGAGWRSHPQRIAIGLSTVALGQIAVQGIWQLIATRSVPHSRAEYEHILGIRDKLFNANSMVYVLVLVWWIISLWVDEPGTAAQLPSNAETADPAPAAAGE